MKKFKEFSKKYLIGFMLGIISGSIVIAYAQTYFSSNDVIYDNSNSGLSSTNVQGAIDELYNVCFPPTPAGDQILEQVDVVTSGDGLYKDAYEDGRYFYKGKNVKNYVTFNNETAGWRIISINSDGTIKIMRNTSIGNQFWDSYSSNNWNRPATLNTYLNGDYYNSLTNIAQSQIVSKDFSIGAVAETDTNLANTINNENSKKWNGKIALPTVSEYIRSNSNQESCGTIQKTYLSTSCSNTSWMSNNTEWWTLTPYSTEPAMYDGVYAVTTQGALNNYPFVSTSEFGIYPVVYLSSNIKLFGSGTQSDPYTLS